SRAVIECPAMLLFCFLVLELAHPRACRAPVPEVDQGRQPALDRLFFSAEGWLRLKFVGVCVLFTRISNGYGKRLFQEEEFAIRREAATGATVSNGYPLRDAVRATILTCDL